MKSGKSLTELAQEIERQAQTKADYIAPTEELVLTTTPQGSSLKVNGHGTFDVSETAHDQIATHLGVPSKFYNNLREKHPDMLDYNANELFRREPEHRT